nr:cyclase family protein [Paracoccus fontiphilus]
MTHASDGNFPTFDGKRGILYEANKNFEPDGYYLSKLTIFEHIGTHIHAPLHFSQATPESMPCPSKG